MLGADFAHRFVDDALEIIRISIGVALPNLLHRAVQYVPADGFFH